MKKTIFTLNRESMRRLRKTQLFREVPIMNKEYNDENNNNNSKNKNKIIIIITKIITTTKNNNNNDNIKK